MITVVAPDGVPEVRAGDDLAALLIGALDSPLTDGDVVVVTSKVVSKAEGRVAQGDREQWIDAETERTVAVRGRTRIVRNRLGLTMAAAGVDASNVPNGSVVLLPLDPDASARTLRAALLGRTGANVGVIVTDTAGRTWREGQTDLAIGAAGVVVLESYAGRTDAHGNELAVTAPALADEIASAAELAQGKLAGRPFAVLRGRPDLVLPAGEEGAGAAVLVRADGDDLFGFGAREAVVRAVAGAAGDEVPFGSPATAEEVLDAFDRAGVPAVAAKGAIRCPADRAAVAAVLAFAHGWTVEADGGDGTDLRTDLRIRPVTP